MDQPNPIKVAWRIIRVLRQVQPPSPAGGSMVDHSSMTPILVELASNGLPGVVDNHRDISDYLEKMSSVDPNTLSRHEALAFWLNLYNAGAVDLAVRAFKDEVSSVLRVPGAFANPIARVGDEALSLDAIEHAKLRRFKDPRIHGALVCGSLSCPTLRNEPYVGSRLDSQLDDQMRAFLSGGGAVQRDDGSVSLSRVFLWFGSDFARSHRMPTFFPSSRRSTLAALQPWLPTGVSGARSIDFQPYDWGLGCTVA